MSPLTPIQVPDADTPIERRRLPRRLDWPLAVAVVGLVACSLYTLHGATRGDIAGQPLFYLERQAVWAVVGLVLMVALSRLDYSRLHSFRWGFYGLLAGSILFVLAIGGATRGSRRWLDLPFFRFQPSELGKLLLILALAGFIVDRVRVLRERDTTVRVMLLALLPAMIVIAQPDLGTGMVYVVIALSVLFIAGTSWRHFAALFSLGAVAITLVLIVAPAAGVTVLKPYQVDRLTAFLHPSDNPAKQGYQQNQSLIAIGAGQRTGRGVAHATQTRLNFLPEHHTDFIFAVVGEQFGFAGCALVLSLYALLIWRALRILTMSKDLFGAVIAGAIVGMMLFQVFVNVGMTIGIMPITGVPLPLMSYGPASVLVTFLSLGLLQAIYVRARHASAGKSRAAVSL